MGAAPNRLSLEQRLVTLGYMVVKGSAFVALMGPVWLVIVVRGGFRNDATTVLGFMAFGIGFALYWLTWATLTPRWRLWAYRRAEDITELRAEAARQRLIWPDSHIFSRTEITTKGMRDELRRLEESKKTP